MRYLSLIVIFLLACGTDDGPSTADGPVTVDGKTARGSDYVLDIPESWEIQKNVMGCDIIALTPLDSDVDSFRENIAVTIENTGKMGIGQYMELNKASLKRMISGYELIREWDAEVQGLKCKRLEYKAVMGELMLHNDLLVVIHEGSAYNVTLGMLQGESREGKYDQLLKVAETFRFE